MKCLLCLVFSLAALCAASAQIPEGETICSFPHNTLVHEIGPSALLAYSNVPDHVKVGTGFQSDPNDALSTPIAIIYDGTGTLHLRLLEWMNQNAISTRQYALVGEVSYEKVSSGSYLEMWSHFESKAPGYPQGSYFSRTLANAGPMGKLNGTSDWRPFWLPFDATGTTTKLASLEMFLNLTGPGTVSLRKLKLVQYPDAPPPVAVTTMPAPPPQADPSQVIVAALPFASFVDLVPGADPRIKLSLTNETDGSQSLSVASSGADWNKRQLVDIPPALQRQVTAARFGVVGEARSNTPIVLTMGLGFVPRLGEKMDEIKEPSIDISRSQDWQPFEIQFDRGNSGYVLEHLNLWIDMYGVATSQFRNLRLVQYPTAFPIDSKLRAGGPFAWSSFLMGAIALGLTQLALAALFFGAQRWQHRRHEREMRRIASIDS